MTDIKGERKGETETVTDIKGERKRETETAEKPDRDCNRKRERQRL